MLSSTPPLPTIDTMNTPEQQLKEIQDQYIKEITKNKNINQSLDLLDEMDVSLAGDIPALVGADIFGDWDNNDKRYYYTVRLQHLNQLLRVFIPEIAEGMSDITDIEAGILLVEGSLENQPMKEMYCDHIIGGIQTLLKSILEMTQDSPQQAKRYLKLMQDMVGLINKIKSENLPSVLRKMLTDFREKYYNVKVFYDARNLPSEVRAKFFEEPLERVEVLTTGELMDKKRANLIKMLEYMKEQNANNENTTMSVEDMEHLGFTPSATGTYINQLLTKKLIKSRKIGRFAHYYLSEKGMKYDEDQYFKQSNR